MQVVNKLLTVAFELSDFVLDGYCVFRSRWSECISYLYLSTTNPTGLATVLGISPSCRRPNYCTALPGRTSGLSTGFEFLLRFTGFRRSCGLRRHRSQGGILNENQRNWHSWLVMTGNQILWLMEFKLVWIFTISQDGWRSWLTTCVYECTTCQLIELYNVDEPCHFVFWTIYIFVKTWWIN